MGPMQHHITPDLSQMAHIGPKPDVPTLGSVDMRSVCETCHRPIVCRQWPRNPWHHANPDDLAELGGESAK